MRRSILAVGACVIAFGLGGGTAAAHESSDGGGNANCSNVVALTSDQCQSTNVAIQPNVAIVNAGDQANNANQNNQPGGGNSNRQQSDDEGNGDGGHSGGGNANCSNVVAATEDQCKSTNVAIQPNVAVVNAGDQSNNANQNNQPGGGNSNRQQSDDEGQNSYRDGHSGGGSGGNANCSNVVAATEDQCKSTNVAIQPNVAIVNAGDQSNNANQNNQPGGGNSNRQQSDDESFQKGGYQGHEWKKNEDGKSHGSGSGGNANCSNVVAATEDQCQSKNVAVQKNLAVVNAGDQSNNANQNNQPGGGNRNRQQSDDEGWGSGGSGGGNANCSNVLALTEDQCKSTNFAYQKNAAFVNFGDQRNNANQNNQPGGGNRNRQQSDDEPAKKQAYYWPAAAVEPAYAGLGLPALILGGLFLTGGLALRRRID